VGGGAGGNHQTFNLAKSSNTDHVGEHWQPRCPAARMPSAAANPLVI